MGIYKPLNYDATMLLGSLPRLEQWELTQTQKTSLWSVAKDTLEMFPAVPADEVEKPPVRPPQRPGEERKALVLLRYTIGK